MLFVGVAFVTLIGAALVPATFTIPVLGFGLMLGLVLGVLHKVKPSYLWLTEWLAARLGWAVKNKEYTHGEDNSEVRYLTRVGQVFPHAIERSDGALVGAMKVEPANMALEDDDAWAKAVDSLSEFVNATIDFPVKFYITSREVDQDDVVRDHQRRLGDADVRSRPVLKRLLDEYITTNTDQNGDIDSRLRPSANTTSSPPFVTLTSSNSTKPAIASWPTSPTSLSWVVCLGGSNQTASRTPNATASKKTSWNHGWDSSAAVGRRSIAAR